MTDTLTYTYTAGTGALCGHTKESKIRELGRRHVTSHGHGQAGHTRRNGRFEQYVFVLFAYPFPPLLLLRLCLRLSIWGGGLPAICFGFCFCFRFCFRFFFFGSFWFLVLRFWVCSCVKRCESLGRSFGRSVGRTVV